MATIQERLQRMRAGESPAASTPATTKSGKTTTVYDRLAQMRKDSEEARRLAERQAARQKETEGQALKTWMSEEIKKDITASMREGRVPIAEGLGEKIREAAIASAAEKERENALSWGNIFSQIGGTADTTLPSSGFHAMEQGEKETKNARAYQDYQQEKAEAAYLERLQAAYGDPAFNEKSAPVQLAEADETYAYINDIDKARAKENLRTSMGGATSPYRRYDAMTEEEIQLYNYLYATEGKEAAEWYLNGMADTFALRLAEDTAPEGTAAQILSGLPAGLQQFTTGISQLFHSEPVPMELGEAYGQVNREKLAGKGPSILGNSLGQTAYDAVQSGANMLVPALIGTGLGPNVSTALFGTSAAGNAYREKLQEGWTQGQAMTYGAVNGILEGYLQKLLGGISGLGGTGQRIAQKVSGIQNAAARAALQFGGSMVSEGLEEGLQEALGPVVEAIITRDDLEPTEAEDIMYSALLGALTAGLIEAPGVVMSGRRQTPAQAQTQRQERAQTSVQSREPAETDMDSGLVLTMPEELRQDTDWIVQQERQGATETTGAEEGGAQTELAETARRLGEALDRDIQLYNGAEETGTAGRADGYYSNGTLHINSRSADPVAQVIGHELTHSLEKTQAYRDLERLVKQHIRDTGGDLAALRAEKKAAYARNGVRLESVTDIDHEIVADYVAKNLLTDEKSIMETVSQDRSLGQRILDFIDRLLARLGNSGAKERVFLTRARNAYARAMAEADSVQRARRGIDEELRGLREDYAQGRITDEQFDEAMQDILEQESLAGRSMLEDDWSGGADGDQYSISKSYQRDLNTWEKEGSPDGEIFVLGATGDVIQGLGAMDQDIYLRSEKVNAILREHPEMTMEEIRRIPEILDDPVLVLKSRNRSGRSDNTRLVVFGTIKAKNGQPVLTVLDLRPRENRLMIDDMQKVNSAYTRDNAERYISGAEVLYADEKRTIPLLKTIRKMNRGDSSPDRLAHTGPIRLLRNGSMGSITYGNNSVNLEGVPFDQVVETQESGRQYSISEETEGKIETEEGETQPVSAVDALPAKAKLYLEKVENAVSRDIRKRWNLSGNESIAPVGNAVRKLSEEYLQNGEISQEAMDRIFDEAYEASGAADNAPELQREDFRTWARHDFDMAAADMPGELKNISRYAQERKQKEAGTAAARAYTTEEIAGLWKDMKAARRNYERVNARNLLTEHDQTQVRRLLKGDIELQHLKPGEDNIKGITNVYNAKLEYEKLSKILREWNQAQKAQRRQRADTFLETANEWKDKPMGILYSRETMERNIRDIVKDKTLADAIIKEYFEPVHRAAADSNRLKNQLRDRVRELGLSRKVEKGNQVSEAYAVQLLGEAEDNIRVLENSQGRIKMRDGKTLEDWQGVLDDLWKENPNLDQEKIRNAVKEFRSIYDQLFEQMNETRIRNGYEPVNYRQGYFPHFQSIDGDGILAQFGRALGIETKVTALPTTINGLTHTFKPGIRWFGNALERKGHQTTYDAVEGFDRYIEGVADVIYQTDNIQNLRALASQARYRTGDEGIRNQIDEIRARKDLSEEDKKNRIEKLYQEGRFALSNFVVELDEYTNLLANKKSLADRTMEQKMGRQMYNLVKGLESRVAANMVAVNPGSWLTNFIPLTQGAATVDGKHMLKGMWDTLRAYQADDGFVDASTFLTNRRGSDPIVKTWAQKASAAASKPMEYIDQFTADSLVRARYSQNIERGMSEAEAMGDADAWAASIMADRSKGATPTLFNQSNPMTKLLTQFQLEVNNQLSYLFKDMPKDVKERGGAALAAALIKFALGAFLYNELYEYLIGRRPALDPLNMLNEAAGDLTGYELPNLVETGVGAIKGESPDFQTEKTGVYGAVSGLLGEAAEQTPFVGGLLGGGRIPISSALPDAENLGKALLYDKWSGEKRLSTAAKEMAKPLLYIAPPFGGGQAKKVAEGIKATVEGGSYSINSDGEKLLQYPVYSDTPGDAAKSIIQSSIFGKTSLPEAKEWINSEFDSYSAKETDQYLTLTDAGAPQREVIGYIDDTQGMKSLEKMRELSEAPWDESIKELGMGYILSEKAMERYMAARDADVGTLDYTYFLESAYENAKKRTGKDTASPSQEDVKNALNDTKLSRSQKRAIWKSYGWKTDSPW